MSTMQDAGAMEQRLAARLKAEREARGWTLAELAAQSGVSRAMISKVERAEASPTAALLGRLCGAFGLTLSMLLARAEADGEEAGRVARAGAQPLWREPATGYLRRAISPPEAEPELIHVELPPGARVAYPAASYRHLRGQCVWVLRGALLFREGATDHRLAQGDCLALGPPQDCEFVNETRSPCLYLVALSRR